MKKKIGILGGISLASTIQYYRTITDIYYEHWITTQRSDRTGVNRDESPQGSLVNHACEADAQALINISRKRLCYCASKETREAWQEIKNKVAFVEPEITSVMVKECVYRNGLCPEFKSCGHNKSDAFKLELADYVRGFEQQTYYRGALE